jgi:hypothetical protein
MHRSRLDKGAYSIVLGSIGSLLNNQVPVESSFPSPGCDPLLASFVLKGVIAVLGLTQQSPSQRESVFDRGKDR